MSSASGTPESGRWAHPAVTMQVPAHADFVSTLRITAASLGANCELTVDDIEDLRLAVDEACALLLRVAHRDSTMDARFELAAGNLAVILSVPSAAGATAPDREGLGWAVLSALATSVDVANTDASMALTVTKRREAPT